MTSWVAYGRPSQSSAAARSIAAWNGMAFHAWTKDPSGFKINPHHLIPGPPTLSAANEVVTPLRL
jgi:hypothetical protein